MPKTRRDLPNVSPLLWITAAVVSAVIITCAVNSLPWLNRAFPGFYLWENLFVPAIADTDWTGYEAHVPFTARVIRVDGVAASAAAQVYQHAASVPVGTLVTYIFERADGSTVELAVPTMRLSLPEYLWTLGTYLSIGTLLCLLGFLVYLLRPDSAAAQAMLCSGGVWGLYFVSIADIIGPAWFRPLCLILQALSPFTLFHLALTFPVERSLLRSRPWGIPFLYLSALPFAFIGTFVFGYSLTSVTLFNQVHGVISGIGGLLLIASMLQSYAYPPSPAARQRTKIAVVGGFLAFFLPVAGIALFALFGVQFPLNFLALPLALFPAAIAYAIVKHDLFEVDAVIRRTVSWAILSAIVALLYLGGVGTIEVLFARGGGRLAQLLFLLLIVAVFSPLRDRVQRAVDFLFARDRYDYRHTLAEASQALATLLDVDAVVARILRTITEAMHVEFGAVWLSNGPEYELHAVGGGHQPSSLPQVIGPDWSTVRALQARPHTAISEEVEGAGAELTRLSCVLVVPMAFEDKLTGLVALGGMESGRFYSSEDVGVLQTLANQGAVAVQNARSYHALRQANDDLRAAQSKLIESERLAAIGELAAAVAHGIRNPLAGIKAAAQFARLDLPKEHAMQESIDDIVSEADKLEARIKTLLDFSKPFQPHPLPCRIDALIRSAVSSLRGQMSTRGVTMQVEAAADLPEMLLDAAQIEEVLLALLGNAAEAMPGGGTIWVRARAVDSGVVRVEVEDNGPGISADRLGRVFDLFFTTKSSGTGFGLAVAKKVVERHRGTIRVVSEPGRGACFIIELPA